MGGGGGGGRERKRDFPNACELDYTRPPLTVLYNIVSIAMNNNSKAMNNNHC